MKLYDSDRTEAEQREAIVGGDVPVAVYGLGKMGLPLAAVLADVTGAVTGVDVDPEVAAAVDRGECHVEGEPGLPELVEETVAEGALGATTDGVEAAADGSLHVLLVPTLVEEGDPDLSALEAAARTVADGLEPGDVVLVESTVPPRTCRDRLVPILAEGSGLDPDDFGVAFCPERTSSGRAIQDIRGAYPKVVGGVDDESTRVATLLYEAVNDAGVIPVSDATTAEAVKVFEGVYRDVNIALANELARFTDELGIDVTEAIETANTQPYCDIHDPGPGVGGHCIPLYPYFLMTPFDAPSRLLSTARRVNDEMPLFAARRLVDLLEERDRSIEGASVLVLGRAYRAGVAETTASPADPMVSYLHDRGADVAVVDPLVDAPEGHEHVPLEELEREDPDAVILVTAHEEFEAVDWDRLAPTVVVDTRRVVDPDAGEVVYQVGSGRFE